MIEVERAGLIVQGYLGDNPLSETRIAIRDNHGWLFIKAKGTLSRFEWQQEIPLYEAQELLKFCPNIIRKVRYIVYHMGNKWEIDEFLGENEGLVIAECELSQATLNPPLPDFVGEEVTEDAVAYFNDEFVRFVNDWKMEISTKTYHLLRDYVHCKSKEVELKLNAPNQTESRTY